MSVLAFFLFSAVEFLFIIGISYYYKYDWIKSFLVAKCQIVYLFSAHEHIISDPVDIFIMSFYFQLHCNSMLISLFLF